MLGGPAGRLRPDLLLRAACRSGRGSRVRSFPRRRRGRGPWCCSGSPSCLPSRDSRKWPIGASGMTGTIVRRRPVLSRGRFGLRQHRDLAVEDEDQVRQVAVAGDGVGGARQRLIQERRFHPDAAHRLSAGTPFFFQLGPGADVEQVSLVDLVGLGQGDGDRFQVCVPVPASAGRTGAAGSGSGGSDGRPGGPSSSA